MSYVGFPGGMVGESRTYSSYLQITEKLARNSTYRGPQTMSGMDCSHRELQKVFDGVDNS
jgi:hypothetical protein